MNSCGKKRILYKRDRFMALIGAQKKVLLLNNQPVNSLHSTPSKAETHHLGVHVEAAQPASQPDRAWASPGQVSATFLVQGNVVPLSSATHIPQQRCPWSACFRGGKCSLAADANTLWKRCSESSLRHLPTTRMPPEMRGRFF